MQVHQQNLRSFTHQAVTANLVGSQQAVLASLDELLTAHRSDVSRQELKAALLSLFAAASDHFAHRYDGRSVWRIDAQGASLARGHQSLLRYIEHAIVRVEQWEASQLLVCLRFLDHALTTQLTEEIVHAT